MNPLVRRALSVVGGMVLAGLVVNTVDALSSHLFPLLAGTNPDDVESVKMAIRALPVAALLLVLSGCLAGGGLGAYAASQFSGRAAKWPGLVVGLLVLAASVTTVLLPYPLWIRIAAVLLVPPSAAAGTLFALRHPADADPL